MTIEEKDKLHITRLLNSFLIPDDKIQENYIEQEINAISRIRKKKFIYSASEVLTALVNEMINEDLSSYDYQAVYTVACSVKNIMNERLASRI